MKMMRWNILKTHTTEYFKYMPSFISHDANPSTAKHSHHRPLCRPGNEPIQQTSGQNNSSGTCASTEEQRKWMSAYSHLNTQSTPFPSHL